MSKIKLKDIVRVFGVLSILSIIGISFFTWRWVDDFRFEKFLQTKGVFEFMWYLYTHWDGRFISIASLIQIAAIKYFDHNFVIFFWAVFFIINTFLIFKIISNELLVNLRLKINDIVLIISSISVCLFYGFNRHISETVYWAVGGVYMINVFFGLIWLLLYRKLILNIHSRRNIILFSLFSLLVGMLTQNLVVCLLVFLLIECAFIFYLDEKRKVLYLVIFSFCLLIGICITSFSPGSFFRMSLDNNTFLSSKLSYFITFIKIFKVYLKASIVLVPFSIVTAIFLFFNLNLKTPPIISNGNRIMSFLSLTKWLIIASASILPMIFIPERADLRTSLFFMIFSNIFIIVVVIKILNYLNIVQLFKYQFTCNICLLLLFICHLLYMSYCYKLGNDYKNYMSETDKMLLSKMNSPDTIVIKNKTLPYYPFVFNIKKWSLSKNPDAEINKEWSFYYDIKNIKAE